MTEVCSGRLSGHDDLSQDSRVLHDTSLCSARLSPPISGTFKNRSVAVGTLDDIRDEDFLDLGWNEACELAGKMGCSPIELEVIRSDEFRHMFNLGQMTSRFTSLEPGQKHNRGQHSLHAFFLAMKLCRRLGLVEDSAAEDMIPGPDRKAVYGAALRLAVLTHDLGQGPFSHCGERTIHELQQDRKTQALEISGNDYLHELRSRQIAEKVLLPLLQDHPLGLSVKHVTDCQRTRGLYRSVLKDIDSLSYLVLDTLASSAAPWWKFAVDALSRDYLGALRFDERNGFFLRASDTRLARAKIAADYLHWKLFPIDPRVQCSNRALIEKPLLRILKEKPELLEKDSTARHFWEMTDDEMIDLFHEPERGVLRSGDIDKRLQFITAFPLSILSDSGRNFIIAPSPERKSLESANDENSPQNPRLSVEFTREAKSRLSRLLGDSAPCGDFFLTAPPEKRHWVMLENEHEKTCKRRTFLCPANPEDIVIVFFGLKPGGPAGEPVWSDAEAERIRGGLANFFMENGWQKEASKPWTASELTTRRDPLMFEDLSFDNLLGLCAPCDDPERQRYENAFVVNPLFDISLRPYAIRAYLDEHQEGLSPKERRQLEQLDLTAIEREIVGQCAAFPGLRPSFSRATLDE